MGCLHPLFISAPQTSSLSPIFVPLVNPQVPFLPKFSIRIETRFENNSGNNDNVSTTEKKPKGVRTMERLEKRGRRTTRGRREIAIFSAALLKCSSNWWAHYKQNKQSTKHSIGRSINQTCNMLIMAAMLHFVQGRHTHTHRGWNSQLFLGACVCTVSQNKTQHVKIWQTAAVLVGRNVGNLISCHVVTGYISNSLWRDTPLSKCQGSGKLTLQ